MTGTGAVCMTVPLHDPIHGVKRGGKGTRFVLHQIPDYVMM